MSEEKPQEIASGGVERNSAGDGTPEVGDPVGDAFAAVLQPAEVKEGATPEESEGDRDAEEGDNASTGGDAPSLEELARALEEALCEAQAHRDMSLRARAELDNARKRAERDVANAHRYGLERFVNEFLPVRDSLELGVSAAGDDADVARVREGMELTLKLMAAAFEKLGIEVVDPAGQPFDPDLHQAMSMQEEEGAESGTVLTVVQKGYRLNERLVRPALVVVAK